jgi:DNA-binding response OmpR family regulator
MRVLLLGGHRPLLKPLKRGLEEEGFQVDAGSAHDDGPWQVRTAEYDAILLDLMGPHDVGRSLLRHWRRAGLQTPVLVLTAPGGRDDHARGGDPGADDWLPKPFGLEELLARLRALVRGTPEVRRPPLCRPRPRGEYPRPGSGSR